MTAADLAGPLAKSGEAAKAGPIGLAVILLLCIACYFLFKSMSKHLRKVRENFPTDEPPQADQPAEQPTEPTEHDAAVPRARAPGEPADQPRDQPPDPPATS